MIDEDIFGEDLLKLVIRYGNHTILNFDKRSNLMSFEKMKAILNSKEKKCYFLKKAIVNNYFNSTCFYWIDSGYFRESKNLGNYTNDWPSTKKCYEDKRLLLLQVRKIDENEKNLLLNLDINAYRKFICKVNVGAGIFGGHFENVLKFINLYYEAIEFLSSKNLFIGKEQDVYTYVALSHPEVVNLILTKDYFYYFRSFLS